MCKLHGFVDDRKIAISQEPRDGRENMIRLRIIMRDVICKEAESIHMDAAHREMCVIIQQITNNSTRPGN